VAEQAQTLRKAITADLIPPAADTDEGMWRYRDLLSLGEGPIRYPLHVGRTPLVKSERLCKAVGVRGLWLKDETRGPSGSNKDRATALVVEHAVRDGAPAITCASTGNVASSLAVGAAAAGLRAVIFVPAGVYPSKLNLMLYTGATVIRVDAGYARAFELSRQAARTFGWADRNTGVNPLTTEAKKTVGLEIWEQVGRRVPDVLVAPVGDGPTLDALARAFQELLACGVTDRLPRIIGVQAEGCQPIKLAWEGKTTDVNAGANTIADGIAVPEPVSASEVLADVATHGGGLVAVTDAEMLSAMRDLAQKAGLLTEPAGAAAYAGLTEAMKAGLVSGDDEVVVLVTGTSLKTPQFLQPKSEALDIHGSFEEVEALSLGG
jgi:threonine synthase